MYQFLHANVLSRGGRPRAAFELLLAEGNRVVSHDRDRAAAMFRAAAGVAGDAGLLDDGLAAATLAEETASTSTITGPLMLSMAGRYADAVPLFERVLAADRGTSHGARAGVRRQRPARPLRRRVPVRLAASDVARREGSPLAAAKAAQVALDQVFVAGDLAASAAYGDEGLAIARQTGQLLFVAWCAWSSGVTAAARGDEMMLEAALAELSALSRPIAWGAVRDAAAAVRGSYRLAVGDPVGAIAALENAVDLDAAQVGNVPIPAPFDLAEAHIRASDLRSAERALDSPRAASRRGR